MADEWQMISLNDWQAEGTRLFGPDVNDWRFVCPSCGHVQTRADWIALGMPRRQIDNRLGFSCIGRWLDPLDSVGPFETSKGSGCKYVGDREPNISPFTIIISLGEERPTFGFDQS